MSHHFRVLREAGVIATRNEGTTHINELRRDDLERKFPGLLVAILAVGAAGPH
jgi:DNA-binding transcriptional ArsR family regulator